MDKELSQQVVENYVIVSEVFRHLPIKALNSAARVCKLWSQVGQTIKVRRREKIHISYITYSEKLELHDGVAREEQIENQILNLATEPYLALIHCTSKLYKKGFRPNRRGPRNPKAVNLCVIDYLRKLLPPNCYLVGTVADGVTGPLCNGAVEEMEYSGGQGFVLTLFPNIPNIDIQPFFVSRRKVDHLSGHLQDGATVNFQKYFDRSEAREPLGLFTFHLDSDDAAYQYDMAKHFIQTYPRAMCTGGLVENFIEDTRLTSDYEDNVILGVMFCGNPESLRLSSLLITCEAKQDVQLEMDHWHQQLRLPDPQKAPRTIMAAFMFSCVGRGRRMYNRQANVESSHFTKLFGGLPISGLFGNGEIGETFEGLPVSGQREPDMTFRHAYSTVLSLLRIYPDAPDVEAPHYPADILRNDTDDDDRSHGTGGGRSSDGGDTLGSETDSAEEADDNQPGPSSGRGGAANPQESHKSRQRKLLNDYVLVMFPSVPNMIPYVDVMPSSYERPPLNDLVNTIAFVDMTPNNTCRAASKPLASMSFLDRVRVACPLRTLYYLHKTRLYELEEREEIGKNRPMDLNLEINFVSKILSTIDDRLNNADTDIQPFMRDFDEQLMAFIDEHVGEADAFDDDDEPVMDTEVQNPEPDQNTQAPAEAAQRAQPPAEAAQSAQPPAPAAQSAQPPAEAVQSAQPPAEAARDIQTPADDYPAENKYAKASIAGQAQEEALEKPWAEALEEALEKPWEEARVEALEKPWVEGCEKLEEILDEKEGTVEAAIEGKRSNSDDREALEFKKMRADNQ